MTFEIPSKIHLVHSLKNLYHDLRNSVDNTLGSLFEDFIPWSWKFRQKFIWFTLWRIYTMTFEIPSKIHLVHSLKNLYNDLRNSVDNSLGSLFEDFIPLPSKFRRYFIGFTLWRIYRITFEIPSINHWVHSLKNLYHDLRYSVDNSLGSLFEEFIQWPSKFRQKFIWFTLWRIYTMTFEIPSIIHWVHSLMNLYHDLRNSVDN